MAEFVWENVKFVPFFPCPPPPFLIFFFFSTIQASAQVTRTVLMILSSEWKFC